MKFFTTLFVLFSIAPAALAATDAVDLEMPQGESAVYILYADGLLQTGGTAINLGYNDGIDAVDFELTKTLEGYYIVDRDGTVYSYGDAVVFGGPASSNDDVVDMELTEGGFYFLRENGSIVTVGSATYRGALEKDGAVDLEVKSDGTGYMVLYSDGSIAFFGTAVDEGFTTQKNDPAVDLELVTGDSYYVLRQSGTLEAYGKAVPYPFASAPSNDIVDMAMTDRGYRTLDNTGQTASFVQLENQGKVQWFAQTVPRDVSPQQQPTATPTVRPTATPRPSAAYFDIARTGFSERVVGSFPEGASIPSGMTTGQLSMNSGDTYMVSGTDTGRSILYFTADGIQNGNASGTMFASLTADRGEAEIRGLSVSKLGMLVTVADRGTVILVLISGDFGDEMGINAFYQHP